MKSKKVMLLLTVAALAFIAMVAMPASKVWADTTNLNPTDDSYVKSNAATSIFGTEGVLTVKSHLPGGPSPTAQNWRALLRFDLSGIPAGSTINKASLVLYMETAPGSTRNYELHYGSNDSWTEGAVTWDSAFTVGTPAPGITGLTDTIPTGTTPVSLTWGANGPNPGPGGEALTSRVTLEFAGDKTISLIIKDGTESNSPGAREASFTSKDTLTANPIPVLVVEYTLPPVACTEATLDLDAFNLYAGPMPIEMFTGVCFDVEYKLKAGCKDLSFVKTQGGFGGNLNTSNIAVTKGGYLVKDVGRGNKVVTWTIPEGLAADEEASLTATVCTGLNPKSKQEFTSCGLKPITGQWSSTAVVEEDGSIISSTPPYTDRLEVEVICP